MKQMKRYLISILVCLMLFTIVTPAQAKIDNEVSKTALDYALYTEKDDISIFSSITQIEGDIYSGHNFTFWGAKYIQGGNIEVRNNFVSSDPTTFHSVKKEKIEAPQIDDEILRGASQAIIYEETKEFQDTILNIETSIYGKEDLIIHGTKFSGKGYILAEGDITYDVASFAHQNMEDKIVIYSRNGDITINSSYAQMNAILYAPNGTVKVRGSDFTLNGRIYANKIDIQGASININTSSQDFELIPFGVSKTYTLEHDFNEGTYQNIEVKDNSLVLKEKESNTSNYIEKTYEEENEIGLKIKETRPAYLPKEDKLNITYEIDGYGEVETSENKGIDLVLVIDDSGSMMGKAIIEAREAARQVVSQMKENDRCAIVGIKYGRRYHEMSGDKASLLKAIDSISAYGGTNISSSIEHAVTKFDDSNREKYIFLLSDGQDSNADQAARRAYEKGIRIFCIGFTYKENDILPRIAYEAHGVYKFAPKIEDIKEIMASFAQQIFQNAGRNVSFQTTIVNKDYLDKESLDENCTIIENEDGSITLTWNYNNIEINDKKEITIPVKLYGKESYKEILRDTSCLYYAKDGTPHILYGEDVTLYANEYEEQGLWTTVYDSKVKDTEWSHIIWNGQRYGNHTTIKVSTSNDGESFSEPIYVQNHKQLENVIGRYIKLEIEMNVSIEGRTPVLEDISIYSKGVETPKVENKEPRVELNYKPTALLNRPYTITMHISDDESVNQLTYKITSDDSVRIHEEATQTPVVIFSELGKHVLTIEVSDGEYTISKEIKVNVEKDKVYENINPEDQGQELKINAQIPSSMTPSSKYTTQIIQESGNPIAWSGIEISSGGAFYLGDGTITYQSSRYTGNSFVNIYACDWYGNCVKKEYAVNVNHNQPKIEIQTDKETMFDNEIGTFTVNFIEKEKIKDISITLNDKEVILDENNQYQLKGAHEGTYELKVSATILSSNQTIETTKTITVKEIDETPPTLDITFNSEIYYQNDEVILNIKASDTQNDVKVIAILDDVKYEVKDNMFQFSAKECKEYKLVIEATDRVGNTTRILYFISINERKLDTTNPTMKVNFEPNEFIVGETIKIKIDAKDDSGKVNISAILNGKELYIENNETSFTVENKSYTLVIKASDFSGNYIEETYTIEPKESQDQQGPKIEIEIDKTKVVQGEKIHAKISAYDASSLSSLKAYFNDIALDLTNGTITITVDKIGENILKVLGIDTLGNVSESIVKIECVEEYGEETYPEIIYQISNNEKDLYINEEIAVEIQAKDIDGIKDLSIKVKDEEIYLDENGKGTYTPKTLGETIFVISATDTRGNQTIVEVICNVIQRIETEAPTVTIHNLKDGDVLTNPTDIIASVTGEGSYQLEIAPYGSEEYTLIAQGTTEKKEEIIGKLDTTLFQNGTYEIKLSGIGSKQINEVFVRIQIEGTIKPGEFSISYKDMEMPVAQLPIIFTRSYASLRRKERKESGYGWKLGVEQVKIEENHIPGEYWNVKNMGSFMPSFQLVEGKEHTVSINWGNGNIEKFKMVPKYTPSLNAEIFDIHIKYEAISGNGSILEVYKDEKLLCNSGKLLNSKLEVFNPNIYKITDVNGIVYIVHETEGVQEIIDKNNNKIIFNQDGIQSSNPNQSIQYIRDTQNRITKIISTLGEVSYKYDEHGDLIEVKDLSGHTTKYVYENHYLTEIIDPRGIKVQRNEYDENGRLIAVIDAEGNKVTYEHDIDGKQEIITDREGNVTQYLYDDYGNVILITDALGNTVKYTYDEHHHMSSMEDVYGNQTLYEYDSLGKLLSVTNAEGFTSTNRYNEQGKVTTISSMNEIQLISNYDELGRLTDTTDIAGNKTSYEYDENGQITSISDSIGVYMKYTYNEKGQVISSLDGENNKVSYTYDDKGRCLTKTVYRGTESLTETYSYNHAGQVKKVIYPDESYITVEYNEIYKISSTTDEIGRRTEYSYDMFGNLTEIRYCDGTLETFKYDKNGRNIEAVDRLGRKVTITYDKVGNLITKTYGNQTKETFTYDKKYRLIERTDVNHHKTVYAYNRLDKNTSITDCLGNTVTFTYNDQGLLTSMSDAYHHTYTYEYDQAGNHIKTIFPDNTYVESKYDQRTRLIAQKDAYGNETKYSYDKNDQLIAIEDANNSKWEYSYSSTGELESVKDPKGNTTEYKYDQAGRVIETKNALGNQARFTYDSIGNIKTYTDYKGNTTEYNYDQTGRIIEIKSDETITYTYSTNGLLTSVKDKNGTTFYEYDIYYGIKKKTLPDGNTLEYNYDQAGNIIEVKTNYGTTTYGYDEINRLNKVIDKDKKETIYTYDNNGNKIKTEYPNHIIITYEYDNCNRLIQETIYKNNEIIEYYKYTLGKNGERLKIEETKQIKTYTYDNLNRLTSESILDKEENITTTTRYTYDGLSNRLTKTTEEGTTTYSYNELNQLLSERKGNEVITYEYDLNGNLIQKKERETITDYVYNQKNQLIQVTIQKGNDVTVESYRYDYEGNRISKTTNETRKNYLVDTNTGYPVVIAQYNDSKEIEVYYTIGDERISLESREGKRYYVFDGHGSTRLLSDETGAISDRYDYDAYGVLIERSGSSENEFLYTGEGYDETTGLYYLRARYMNPSTGTFISMDPYSGTINDPVSLHKYLYANANPVSYIDPTGYFSIADMQANISIQAILNKAKNGVTLKLGLNILDGLCTVNDLMHQIEAGENLEDIAKAMVQGGITSIFLNMMCRIKTMGVIFSAILLGQGLKSQVESVMEAWDKGDWDLVITRTIQLAISIGSLSQSCFTEETLIETEDGYKEIKDIEVGDKVLSYNVETKQQEYKEVVQVFEHEVKELIHVYTEEEIVHTTENHPFYVEGSGWTPASELKENDILYTSDGRKVIVTKVEREQFEQSIKVYNFEVKDYHTYYVGEEHVLVHNNCKKENDILEEKTDSYPNNRNNREVNANELRELADKIKSNNGTPPKGYKGGKKYKNVPKTMTAQKLPDGVNYKEYDIFPKEKNINRGDKRLVIGDDGSVWYTDDHYATFKKIK